MIRGIRGRSAAERIAAKKQRNELKSGRGLLGGPGGILLAPQFDSFGRAMAPKNTDPYAVPIKTDEDDNKPRIVLSQGRNSPTIYLTFSDTCFSLTSSCPTSAPTARRPSARSSSSRFS